MSIGLLCWEGSHIPRYQGLARFDKNDLTDFPVWWDIGARSLEGIPCLVRGDGKLGVLQEFSNLFPIL